MGKGGRLGLSGCGQCSDRVSALGVERSMQGGRQPPPPHPPVGLGQAIYSMCLPGRPPAPTGRQGSNVAPPPASRLDSEIGSSLLHGE
jgi:hypothetical protein